MWMQTLSQGYMDKVDFADTAFIKLVFKDFINVSKIKDIATFTKRMTHTKCRLCITDSNHDCRMLWTNYNFQLDTGYTMEDICGKRCHVLQHPDLELSNPSKFAQFDKEEIANIKAAVVGYRSYSSAIFNYRKDGQPFINVLTFKPIQIGGAPYFISCQWSLKESIQVYPATSHLSQILHYLPNSLEWDESKMHLMPPLIRRVFRKQRQSIFRGKNPLLK